APGWAGARTPPRAMFARPDPPASGRPPGTWPVAASQPSPARPLRGHAGGGERSGPADRGPGSFRFRRAGQAGLLRVVAERPEGDAEQLGRLGLDAAGARERLLHQVGAEAVERRLEIEALVGQLDALSGARLPGDELVRQIRGGDHPGG